MSVVSGTRIEDKNRAGGRAFEVGLNLRVADPS